MVTGKETIAGGFDPAVQLRGLAALIEAHCAQCAVLGRPLDPEVVTVLAVRLSLCAQALEEEARD